MEMFTSTYPDSIATMFTKRAIVKENKQLKGCVFKMKKSLYWLVGIFMLLGAALAGCSSSTSSSSGAKNVPQSLTYASTTKPVGLSPIMTNDSVSSTIIDQIYETLFVKDPKTMEIKPGLAESYETPNDTTWVIHLRKNV